MLIKIVPIIQERHTQYQRLHNPKPKIQDTIDQKVTTLKSPTPNVNSNPLPTYGGTTPNMIEIKDEWVTRKMIIKVDTEKPKETKEYENEKGEKIVLP